MLCNQCPSPLKFWVRISFMERCTRYNNMWWSLSMTCSRSEVFSRYSGFLHQHIVESGVKHHNHKPNHEMQKNFLTESIIMCNLNCVRYTSPPWYIVFNYINKLQRTTRTAKFVKWSQIHIWRPYSVLFKWHPLVVHPPDLSWRS